MSSAQAGKSLHSLQVLQISTGPAGFKLLGKRVELLPPFTFIHLPAPSPAMLHKVSQHLGADAKVKLSTGKSILILFLFLFLLFVKPKPMPGPCCSPSTGMDQGGFLGKFVFSAGQLTRPTAIVF